MKKIVIFFSVIGIMAGLSLVLWQHKTLSKWFSNSIVSDLKQESSTQEEQNNIKELDISSPFYQLTIPYFQNRNYDSQLDELTEYQQFPNYTSYLTSYQSDQLKINALLTIPTGNQPTQGWPAIIFLHGYIPPDTYQTTQRYQEYVDYLAKNKFVVFKIDLRGHGDSEGIPGGAYFSGDYVIDTLNAHAALAKADFVDQKSIGLWGHSMAGNIVLRSMVAQTEIPAGVIWAGAVYTYEDMSRFGIQDDSYERPEESSQRQIERSRLFEEHDRSNLETEFWQQVIPTNYLNSMKGALQLHHANNDSVVSVEYSRNLEQLLSPAGVKHQFYEYSEGGHNLTGANFSQAMRRTVEFFDQNL